jgi:glutaminase
VEDIVEFFKLVSNTENVEIDYNLAYEEKITGHSNHALSSLMLSNNVFPKYENPKIQLQKA